MLPCDIFKSCVCKEPKAAFALIVIHIGRIIVLMNVKVAGSYSEEIAKVFPDDENGFQTQVDRDLPNRCFLIVIQRLARPLQILDARVDLKTDPVFPGMERITGGNLDI